MADKNVSLKLFLSLMGALAFFTVVIMGGMQWSIKDSVSSIEKSVAVQAEVVKSQGKNISELKTVLADHSKADDRKHSKIDRDIEEIKIKVY